MRTYSGCDGGRRVLRNGGARMSYGVTSHFRRLCVTTFIPYTLILLKMKCVAKPKTWIVKKLVSN